jgi:hypothetical protein
MRLARHVRYDRVMRLAVMIALVSAVSMLNGCDWSHRLGERLVPDTASMSDRCVHFMRVAMPFADIDVTDQTSTSPDLRTIVSTVTATRANLPKDSPADHDLAAECTFTDSVLTAFRWTKGGPQPTPQLPLTQSPPSPQPPH